jgi:hypothetical protein
MDRRFATRSSLAAFAACGSVIAAVSTAEPAQAAPKLCGDRIKILERLAQRHQETPNALGLSADGAVLELLVSPEGGWTILMTYPDKPTCIMAIGEAWQDVALIGERA